MRFFGLGAKAEERARTRVRGDKMPASGALAGAKADYNLPEFKVEVKATQKLSRGIRLKELLKITNEAASENRAPALQLIFANGNGQPLENGSWFIIPESAFKELTERE